MIASSFCVLPLPCRPNSLQSTARSLCHTRIDIVCCGQYLQILQLVSPLLPSVFPAVYNPIWLPLLFTALSVTVLAPGAHSGAAGRWQPAWWPTYLLCKWKCERSGSSASQSLATCSHMTLTWCPGMYPGRPRSFPIPEKYSAKCNSFFQMATPQFPFTPSIPPVSVLTWQQFSSSRTIFLHICYQISSYTKFFFFQGLIRLKVLILQVTQ